MASTSPKIGDSGKIIGEYPLLASAIDQLALSQRRNAEVATEVAKITAGCVRAAWQKQWMLFDEFVAHTGHQDLWAFGAPRDESLAKRTAVAKASVEKVIASAQEITDLFVKSGIEAADLWTKRINESLAELQALPGKTLG